MKPTHSTFVLALFLLLLGAASALAQTSDVILDEVIITARGTDSSVSHTPGGAGVVTEEDILLEPKASVADALNQISGLTRTGESLWGQAINIRGLSGSSVVVLIDGMRLNTATEINARLGFINPMDIERVEVLKGPASALYGTGSTGGVVNIITKKGHFSEETEGTGELIVSYSTNPEGGDGYVRGGVNSERVWMQFSGGLRAHDDYYGGDDTRMINSSFEDYYGRVAGGVRLTDLLTAQFQVMTIEANEVGIPGGSSTMPQTAPIDYPRTSNTLVSLDTVYTPEDALVTEVLLNLYYMQNDRRVQITKPVPAMEKIRPKAGHETVGGKLQTVLQGGPHTLVAGVDAWNWHMNSSRAKYLITGVIVRDQPTPNTNQFSMGIFAEDDWVLNDEFTLNIGARLDRVEIDNRANAYYDAQSSEDIGWNGHIGLTWTPSEYWTHTLLAASAYRAADLIERFKNISLGGGITAEGNPNLDPEQTYFLEYGLHYNTGAFRLDGSLYANFITDYIAEQAVTAVLLRMENIGEARIYGSELDAEWKVNANWSLYGNLALCQGYDEKADEPLRNISPLNGMLGVKYAMANGLWVSLETPWAASQTDVPEGVDTTDEWMTVDAAVGYGFDWKSLHHDLSLSVNNVFDEKYNNYLANSRGIELLETGINAALVYKVSF